MRRASIGRDAIALSLPIVFALLGISRADAATQTVDCGQERAFHTIPSNPPLVVRITNTGNCTARVRAWDVPNEAGTPVVDLSLAPGESAELNKPEVIARSVVLSAIGSGTQAVIVFNPLLRNSDTKAAYWQRAGDHVASANLGNVGIGTTSPTAKLDVNGSIAVGGRTVIDASGRLVGDLPPRPTAQQVALLRWYEANQAGISFPVGNNPNALAFDGAHVWVTNRTDNSVSKVRTFDGTLVATYPAGSQPIGIAFDGAHVWVANTSDTVTKLRASDGVNLGTFPVGSGPFGVAFDGSSIWVTNRFDGTISRIQPSTGASTGTFPAGSNPFGVAFDGVHLWVTNFDANTVTKLRASDGATVGTFAVGRGPLSLAFDGAHVWVTNSQDHTVTRLRASDGAVLATVPAGMQPRAIVFDGSHVWVANQLDNTVTKLRASDASPVGTFAAGVQPLSLAFDGANVWVVNSGSASVTKL
jgi:YVTN family beta-propeller protein